MTFYGILFNGKSSLESVSAPAAKGHKFYFLDLLLKKTDMQFGRTCASSSTPFPNASQMQMSAVASFDRSFLEPV